MDPIRSEQCQSTDKMEEDEASESHVGSDSSSPAEIPEWMTYPEIPTARDLNPDYDNKEDLARVNSLLPNEWRHPWSDKNKYLETHYRLQREEAIAMLRYSIRKYRETPSMLDGDETCVYTKIYVQGYLMTRLGPMCRVQFSTERAKKKIRWNQTRRLTAGKLVALSTAKDGFKTICMPAVIADHCIRGGLDQNPPTIQIFWANMSDAVLDPTVELVMLESRMGYFEAVRHTMLGLQHVANTVTPFDKYLVSLDKCDLTAKYVVENPDVNLASLVHHLPSPSTVASDGTKQKLRDVKASWSKYNVLDGINDQISPYTNLDNSQLSAVHRILTKELAIIQGPPGTGKTFTSVQALQIMLESQRTRGESTIVVAAQTNHAVDQILTQLINLGFHTVRLGGRTQSEEMKRYSMFNLRRFSKPSRYEVGDKEYKALEAARKRNIRRVDELVADTFYKDMIDPLVLQKVGIITEKQLDSLLEDEEWMVPVPGDQSPEAQLPNPFEQWLGEQRVAMPSVHACNPEFDIPENDDEADFEAEDYDIELDDCIADDDEDRGRVEGRWIPIKYQWTGANPQGYDASNVAILRDLNQENLWDIAIPRRGAVYQYWQRELLRRRLDEFRTELTCSARICKQLKANRWCRDLQCVRMADIEIIGCTTTGLCKYRDLLAALEPRTMLIEEAAETKEASILSALYPSLQQLILVGDHQQLTPSCDTPFLDDEPFNIRVSMFERLVKLNMPYTMLNMQRRMHPILRELLNPYYPSLQDHPVVTKSNARPPIPGMTHQSFFFHHVWNEGTDDNLSRFNIMEAEMIVNFIEYLRLNGVKDTEITVLTFYQGQRKKILSDCRKRHNKEPFTNVHTVDSYQGEENDIVILSLVRSGGPHGPHNAGFLRDSNRGVVSISRARRGFYIFGNMVNLLHACAESWAMWKPIFETFKRQERFSYDRGLPITCQQHGNTTWIKHPEDWVQHHGGCTKPCEEKLACGHDCGRRCHWIQHSRLICSMPCEQVLNCGHRCQHQCSERCGCDCEEFTGAYPNDEVWDEDEISEPSDDELPASPFVGCDSRVGRPYQRDRRALGRPGRNRGKGKPRAQGLFPRPNFYTNRDRATFDARIDDAQRRGHEPATRLASKNSSSSAKSGIRQSLQQAEVNSRGKRNLQGKGVSKTTSASSTDKVGTMRRDNVSGSVSEDDALLSFDEDNIKTKNVKKTDSKHLLEKTTKYSYSTSGEESDRKPHIGGISLSRLSLMDSLDDATYVQQHNEAAMSSSYRQPRTSSYIPRMGASSYGALRRAGTNALVEDRPEWDGTRTQDTKNTKNGDATASKGKAENGGALIDLL